MISSRLLLVFAIAALLLTSCASPGPIDHSPPPSAIQLNAERQISTYHFPRGVYSLADTDATGYFYSAPAHVMKHGFPGSLPYDGGIFMDKNDHKRLRAYLIWGGGRTKIGNLSNADYTPRD